MGDTTWNIGRLSSDNPQNVLSPELSCRLYFRTTFATDDFVSKLIPSLATDQTSATSADASQPQRWQKALKVESIGGDAPANYFTLPGFETSPAAFGSDAPHLSNFEHRAICGPGSIRFAHTDNEHIDLPDLRKAVEQYIAMFKALK